MSSESGARRSLIARERLKYSSAAFRFPRPRAAIPRLLRLPATSSESGARRSLISSTRRKYDSAARGSPRMSATMPTLVNMSANQSSYPAPSLASQAWSYHSLAASKSFRFWLHRPRDDKVFDRAAISPLPDNSSRADSFDCSAPSQFRWRNKILAIRRYSQDADVLSPSFSAAPAASVHFATASSEAPDSSSVEPSEYSFSTSGERSGHATMPKDLSGTSRLNVPSPRTSRSFTLSGPNVFSSSARSFAGEVSGLPSYVISRSPASIPAFSPAEPGSTLSTISPFVWASCDGVPPTQDGSGTDKSAPARAIPTASVSGVRNIIIPPLSDE